MSEYFSGVTFAQQRLRPADDANVRRVIFPDCILTGCAFASSGPALSMDAGYLMICGRQIRHPYSQIWTLNGTAGVARLKLTVTVTWQDGREVSHGITPSVDYAANVSVLPALTQGDINAGSKTYQVMLCVVQLGAGGITGYLDKIPTIKEVSQ